MPPKKRGLGRPLNALLASSLEAVRATTQDELATLPDQEPTSSNECPIHALKPGRYQPRGAIQAAELESLSASIKAQGLLQPIVVRPLGADKFEILAGERRWRAAELAGLKRVPIVVKAVNDQEALAIGLIENIQRQDLNAVEEAIALDRLGREFELTHNQIAEAVGKSRASVTNILRYLTLNEDVRLLLARGEIDAGHAKVLLGIKGGLQSQLARQVVAQQLSVRETEKLLERVTSNAVNKSTKPIDPDIKRLQSSLSDKLGALVKIVHGQKGQGKIVIKYNDLDELDGILAHLH